MPILSFLLCSVVLACFLFIAFRIRRGYRIRRDFFVDCVRFCDHLLTEINFSKNTIGQVIERYIDTYSPQFVELLLKYSHMQVQNADITREGLKTFIERDDVADFFYELGKHSAEEECEKIKSARLRFEAHLSAARERLSKDASIYFKICIIVGVGVVIILI